MEIEPFEVECKRCRTIFKDFDLEKIIYLENCAHVVCLDCIKKEIIDHYPEVECPEDECTAKMPDWEISHIIGQQSLEELQKNLVMKCMEEE